jgi:hypothetical protein
VPVITWLYRFRVRGDGSVTEKLVHELGMVPSTEQQGGASVRKVMEADVR